MKWSMGLLLTLLGFQMAIVPPETVDSSQVETKKETVTTNVSASTTESSASKESEEISDATANSNVIEPDGTETTDANNLPRAQRKLPEIKSSAPLQSPLTAAQKAQINALPAVNEAQLNRNLYARSSTTMTTEQQKIVTEVKRHLNKPYRWGAAGPNDFDCSGLVQYAYLKSLNIPLQRVTYQQEKQGTEVARSSAKGQNLNLKAGDLLFYGPRNATTHVALYIGDGLAIHAPYPGQRVSAFAIQYFYPDFARRIIKDELPVIKNGTSITIKSGALSYSDGSWIQSADRNRAYTITGYKKITEKWGSRKIYAVKESKKWLYELDVQPQTSSYGLLGNGTIFSLKSTAGSYQSGGKITANDKKSAFVIDSVRYIPKKFGSIRAYRAKGSNRWYYECDVTRQVSSYSQLGIGTVFSLKKTAGSYQSGGKITANDKKSAFVIDSVRYIPKKFGSIRAYRAKGSNRWYYECDVTRQTSSFKELKVGTKVVTTSRATHYQTGGKITSGDKNKVHQIERMRLIPKRGIHMRIYKMKGSSRWYYEGDVALQTSSFKALKKGQRLNVKTSARSYQSGGWILKSDYKKTFTIKNVRDIRKKYGSIRAYQVNGSNKWYYEADVKGK